MTMTDGIVTGDGYATAHLEDLGDGPGFRKVRRALDVKELGINAIVMPAGFSAPAHWHDEQEEVYFVHRGRLALTFGDGRTVELAEGGVARVDAATRRTVANPGDEDLVVYIVGAKGGYVGRDGRRDDPASDS